MDRKRKFEIAARDHVDRLRLDVGRVLHALGFALEDVLITDESRVGDFAATQEALTSAVAALGVDMSAKDYVWQVAERLSRQLIT